MPAAAAKRSRGRPRTTPKPAPGARAGRLRKDGAAYKAPTRISAEQLAAWLEAHHQRYWSGRGRPPQGSIPLVRAAAEHFSVSRRTVARLVAVIAQRRVRLARTLPLDATAAGLLAALSERYRRMPAPVPAPAPAPAVRTRARSGGPATTAAQAAVRLVAAGSSSRDLDEGILRYLDEHADQGLLERLAAVIERRRRAAALPSTAAGGGRPGARGLEAIGLQASAGTSPSPGRQQAASVPTPRRGEPIREALLEALEAYAALGDDGVLRTAADALARQLALRSTFPR